MLPRLASKEEMTKFLREHIDSREWWVLLPSHENGSYVTAIEEHYYSGEASADFTAILGMSSSGLFSVYLAHKRRMSAEQLFDMLKDDAVFPITVAELQKRDIVFLAGWQESQRLVAALAELGGY